ncbi:MAG: hypothetical protein ACRDTU_09700, partial [Micromonosporaceae bacterium]
MAYRLADLGADSMPALLPSGAAGSDWADLRQATERTWRHYLGSLPDSCPVRYTIVDEVSEASHIRRHLVYEAPGGERVPALLLLPRDATAGRGRAPAVLALHPTVDTGKADVATPEGRPDRRYGLELVERGYVVLAP